MASRFIQTGLRNMPGYTNYVVGANKNINGVVSSAELKRYYSNIDAEVYFNGEWVEDISDINWRVDQKTMPLFGYNSYIWDDIAQGSRVISGMFVVNFTRPGFVADAIAEGNGAVSNTYTDPAVNEDVEEFLIDNGVAYAKHDNTPQYNPTHDCIWKNNFDIDIVCGETEEMTGSPVHIVLKNCVVINSSAVRTKDGDVSAEQYQFIARDFLIIE